MIMLSQEHRAIITATVPILQQGGETLTRHFYKKLFSEYPQVLPFFNQAHQHSGTQQRALANSILMYAANIERLETLGPLVKGIVHKHAALQIQPEHYPMVGAAPRSHPRSAGRRSRHRCRYRSLGCCIWSAGRNSDWRRAGNLYKERTGTGWLARRTRISGGQQNRGEQEITSFVLAPADGAEVMDFLPGQYITVLVDIQGEQARRQYSLSDSSNGRTYRISVKRETGGKVSNYLHDQIDVGSQLSLFPPAGAFTLTDSEKPLVLISGGVGITPTLAMLNAALQTRRPVHFIHAARHAGVHAFRSHIDALAAAHPQMQRYYVYEHGTEGADATGFLSQKHLEQWIPASRDVDAYFLGPLPFMKAVKSHLREIGVPEAQSHYEFSGPAEALPVKGFNQTGTECSQTVPAYSDIR
jgi:nitric oxide dioxygenase